MPTEPSPAISITPDQSNVGPQRPVAEFGLTVADAGPYTLTLEGSADLAATLMDQDGVAISAVEDGAGASLLRLDAKLDPGTYTLHVRAARKGTPASVRVSVRPA